MADTEVDSLLENVEQFINDENKIVTYEFLSQSCGIHVNLAKNVLERYANNLKKKDKSNLYEVVYSVGGYVGKNLKSVLVKDINLEKVKSKLDKVLSVHVYSVQKGKLESFGVLYNSNLTELKRSIQQCCGLACIVCHSAKLKPASELAIKTGAEVKKIPETTKPTLTKEETNKSFAVLGKAESPKETSKTAHEPTNPKEKVSRAAEKKTAGKPAISAFFAKHQVKEPVDKKLSVGEDPKKPTTNKRVVREPSDDEIENENTNVEDKTSNNGTKRLKLSEAEKPLTLHTKTAKTKKVQKKEKPGSKKSGKTQRKRIQQFSDSESSGDEEEDEDIVLSSPERPVPAPMSEDDEDVLEATIIEPSSNPKRTRKLVPKTFMDKDGFVVTTREYETCLEENEVTPKTASLPQTVLKAEVPPPAAKQPSPPGKTKQKSITSFFTRK